MSILPTLCAYVALPNSHIKNPGHLLKETNKLESTEQKIQRHLKLFQASTPTASRPLERSHSIPERNQTLILSNKGYSSSRDVSPKKKMASQQISDCLCKAIKILGYYNITLNLEIFSEKSQELDTVLKVLVPELCFFSEKFVKMLQIEQIVICNQEGFADLSRQYPRNTMMIPVGTCETEENIAKIIYKFILAQLIKVQPAVLEEWTRTRMIDTDPAEDLGNVMESLENFFIALMQNLNLVRVKSNTNKLKDLLIQIFPEEFSHEWFKNRGKEKKRSCKVQFTEDC